MVFSIHPRSHKGLSQIFLEHQVDKRYLALVEIPPDPSCGEIRSMLARSRKFNRTVSVEHGGKDAITRYRTRQLAAQGALLEIELLTGRSHQIRAHLSEAGSALLGDSLYGGEMCCAGIPLTRPLLHAYRLAFVHPVTAEKLAFELPLPVDMQRISSLLFDGPA
jgi:23S rRNA pseudouridine1911/1915/1917 synthase